MFRIKICGITSTKDAQYAVLAGADAIGLNFYEPSPRSIDIETAEKICHTVQGRVAKVGVFVNADVDEITGLTERLSLDYVQLHGDESLDFMASLGELAVLRAMRLNAESFSLIQNDLSELRTRVTNVAGIVLDARVEGEYGGTGEKVDWQAVAANRTEFGDTPLVLAGGLTPFNVAEAIALTTPEAVDVASGVESEPGKKDLLLIRAFCNAARKALGG